jgi:hypothetical protein
VGRGTPWDLFPFLSGFTYTKCIIDAIINRVYRVNDFSEKTIRMLLTESEIRDINRYLADGKPLPDKYRFLLFEDKREVELVWNGKTNEVTNVVLPFQVKRYIYC